MWRFFLIAVLMVPACTARNQLPAPVQPVQSKPVQAVELKELWAVKAGTKVDIPRLALRKDGVLAECTGSGVRVLDLQGREMFRYLAADTCFDLQWNEASGNLHLLTSDGHLSTLDDSGKLLNQVTGNGGIQLQLSAAGQVYIDSEWGDVDAYDANGKSLWRFSDPYTGAVGGCEGYSTTTVGPDNRICFFGLPRESYLHQACYALSNKFPALADHIPLSPMPSNGFILSPQGKLEHTIRCGVPPYEWMGSTIRDGHIYAILFRNEGGPLMTAYLRCTDENDKVLWERKVATAAYEPVVKDGKIWLAGATDKDGHLYTFNEQGRLLKHVDFSRLGIPWKYATGPILLDNGVMVLGTADDYYGTDYYLWFLNSDCQAIKRIKTTELQVDSLMGRGKWIGWYGDGHIHLAEIKAS